MADSADFERLARALRELHRALMERAKRDFERVSLTVVSPGEMLKRLTTDPAFAWLRELSELMADVDIVRDGGSDVLQASAGAIRPAVEHLLGTPDSAEAFPQRYWAYVHDEPHVAMAHAGVKQALNAFPAHEAESSRAERRRHLAEQAAALGRKPQAS